jgi:DNA-binding MarR family transcriptional regulator
MSDPTRPPSTSDDKSPIAVAPPERVDGRRSRKTPPGRSPAANALSRLVIQVFQLNGLFLSAGDAMAKPAGQTAARWQLLAAVEGSPATVAQIARALRLARQSVQRVADLLVADGLAAYEDNPSHRRAKLLRLAPSGRAALDVIQAAQRVWANELGAQIGTDDIERASVVLERILRTLTDTRARAARTR